jgi:hypothetical protein
LKASIEGRERSQKKPRERRWQFRQLSTQRKPDVLICAPPSPAETRVRRSASNKRQALIIRIFVAGQTFFAEGNNRAAARRLPFHFGFEPQCLLRSARPRRPGFAGGLAMLPVFGRFFKKLLEMAQYGIEARLGRPPHFRRYR